MKNNFLKSLAALALACGLCSAQTTTTMTTLSQAVTDTTSTTFTLASATGVAANGTLYLTDGETVTVLGSYTSGTSVPVARGAQGTKAIKHVSGQQVAVFPPGNAARVGVRNGILPGGEPRGACTAATEAVLPIFNSVLGARYDCLGGQWVRTGMAGSTLYCGATSGATATCTPVSGVGARTIGGIATLAGSTQVLTFLPAFSSSSSYSCVGDDITTRANPVQVVATSATSITITNTT
jgi:hypothetical protein